MPTLNDQEFTRSAIYTVGVTPASGPFPIPFPFYDLDTIRMFIDGVETTAFTVTQASLYSTQGNTVMLDAPVSDAVVVMWSDTGPVRTTGDSFVQAELSKEIDRLFANLQEMRERGIWLMPTTAQYDAGSNRISNLSDPVDPQDAVTLDWATSFIADALAGVTGASDAVAEFRRLYLGTASIDPTADNLGKPVQEGALYWNIPNTELRVYTSGAWLSFAAAGGTLLPNIQTGDASKFVAIKQDESGYEYVAVNLPTVPTPKAGTSFVLLAGIAAPNGTDAHIPFGIQKLGGGNAFVSPLDMTLDAATMNGAHSSGLRQDATIDIKINGVSTQLFFHLAGWSGIDTQTFSIPIAKGDEVELTYTGGNNYSRTLAFALHFTSGVGGGSYPLVMQNGSIGGGETNMLVGNASYYAYAAMPVALTIDNVAYHTTVAASQAHTVNVYVQNVLVGSAIMQAGQQSLEVTGINATVNPGETIHTTVSGNYDAGSPSVCIQCTESGGDGATAYPFLVADLSNAILPDDFSPGKFTMPFSGSIVYAAVNSANAYPTPEPVTLKINGAPVGTLATLSDTGGVKEVNENLSFAFQSGDVLEISNPGNGVNGADGILTLGFAIGGTAVVVGATLPTIKTTDAGNILAVNNTATGAEWIAPSSGGAPSGPAQSHRYWRVVGKTHDNTTYWSVAEVEFRDSAGGADLSAGATTGVIFSAQVGGAEGVNAFDRNPATVWGPAANAVGPWIGYDFGAGNTVAPYEIALTANASAGKASEMFRDFDLEYSDDNVTWTLMQSYVGIAAYADGEQRAFAIDQGSAAIPGPKGDPGTSVQFGSDVSTASLGDVYYHTNGNVYQITTLGGNEAAQTLMGAWTAAEKGWEPFGGEASDPTIFAYTVDGVQEIVTPTFVAGYDYELRWKIRALYSNTSPVLSAEKPDGSLIQPQYGLLGKLDPARLQIGGATILNPVAVQDYLQVKTWFGSVTYGSALDQAADGVMKSIPYYPVSPASFTKMRLKCTAGYFTPGTVCKLYRRKTAA